MWKDILFAGLFICCFLLGFELLTERRKRETEAMLLRSVKRQRDAALEKVRYADDIYWGVKQVIDERTQLLESCKAMAEQMDRMQDFIRKMGQEEQTNEQAEQYNSKN